MISALVNASERSERSPLRSEQRAAVQRVGQAVSLAVERFVTVGETIGDDNPEIKVDMYEACKEARAAGSAIEKLCALQAEAKSTDRATLVRAARCLLSSVTKVLLLADTVVVKQLILSKDKAVRTLSRLKSVTNFTEFVKAFSQFGQEMVEFAHLTGSRQSDLKDERRRAQITAARQVLERSTMMLLTSSKAVLRHPDCPRSRDNRDTVFCQMRRAMDLIHYVVKDGILDTVVSSQNGHQAAAASRLDGPATEDWDANHTLTRAIQRYEECVEMTRMTLCGETYRERLSSLLETISERSQDFTDSAYTPHQAREHILLLCERAKLELNQLLRCGVAMENRESTSPTAEYDESIANVLKSMRELRSNFQAIAMEQASELIRGVGDEGEVISGMKASALAVDTDRLEEFCFRFQEHSDHVQEVCKLLRHVAPTETLQIASKYSEINLRLYGPQLLAAAHIVCLHPNSKIAKENFEAFADMWLNLVGDVKVAAREISECLRTAGRPAQQPVYMSLPRPGKHGTTSKQVRPGPLDAEEQAKISKSGLEMKLANDEMAAEADKWQEVAGDDQDNDILRRAKAMSQMALGMYQFTRGDGTLKTTQDLFTQAEYFTEEANRLYKVVRQFSYQVPQGANKKELLEYLDQIPTHVQQLQFAVKTPTVGKAATFTKVDNVIQDTKSAMNVISRVVNICFACASKYEVSLPGPVEVRSLKPFPFMYTLYPTDVRRLAKYNLDFRGLSPRGPSASPYRGSEGADDVLGSGSAGGSGGAQTASSDPNI
ncbi:alpha-catulin-like isoform X3 [Amphibalanus amphitrite]|uniref:alpha-catulin-like isoform X3 n=1 Tax=Amphibalanus amphitrite TaxID=1232801 RepID=UPI001C9034EA|nr:alpha-catulin-like isoform X3 [Amphibalanus amphitrite]